jgi:hypothetical protein
VVADLLQPTLAAVQPAVQHAPAPAGWPPSRPSSRR